MLADRMASTDQQTTSTRPRYRWPRFLLAAVVLGVLLYIVWMAGEIERARRIRDANAPFYRTNAPSPGR